MKKLFLLIVVILTFKMQAQDNKWTLRACVDYAIENNISVKQSELDLMSSELNKKDAVGNYLPSLNASGNHSWNVTNDIWTSPYPCKRSGKGAHGTYAARICDETVNV